MRNTVAYWRLVFGLLSEIASKESQYASGGELEGKKGDSEALRG